MRDYCFAVGDAEEASSILLEAAQWMADSGFPMWTPDELTVQRIQARADETVVCRDDEGGIAAMQLWREDAFIWPDVPARSALYLHKLAVRRRRAGQDVPLAMIEYAVGACREMRRPFLRLDCDAGRAKLMRLYESAGFVPLGVSAIDTPRGRFSIMRYQMEAR